MKLLLFDIDGTLLNASPSGRLAFSDALTIVTGVADTLEEISFHGQTDPAIWRRICRKHHLPETSALEQQFYAVYEDCLRERLHQQEHKGRTCPGIRPLLAAMAPRQDIVLSILTGNIESGAKAKLEAFQLDHFFQRGAYGSDHHDRNQLGPVALRRAREKTGHPIEPHECWVIGDTPWDVQCGKALGAHTLGVGTGGYSPRQLLEEGADAALADLSDLREVAKVMDLS